MTTERPDVRQAASAWGRLLAVSGARNYLGILAGLLLWASLPLVLGWQHAVVTSGSMAPAIAAGDVVVAQPVDLGGLTPGDVVLVEDPAHHGGLLTHRLHGVRRDGSLVLKGDANAGPDSTAVAASAVRGQVRLRVPFVGRPLVWVLDRDWVPGALWLLATSLAVRVAAVPLVRTRASVPPGRPTRPSRRGRGRPHLRRPRAAAAAVAATTLGTALVAPPVTGAAFAAASGSTGNTFAAAADWVAPTTASATVAAVTGSTTHYYTGFVRPGGDYRVYAAVTDAGNPASGVADVTADVAALTPGATASPLSPGTFSVGGSDYGYGWTSSLTAATGLTPGVSSFSVRAVDAAGNAEVPSARSVTVDGTAPTATDVQMVNGGASVGRAETGDRVVFSFSEPVEPVSLFAPSTQRFTKMPAVAPVVVRITRSGNGSGATNDLTIWNAAQTTHSASLASVRLSSAAYNTDSGTPLTFTATLTVDTTTATVRVVLESLSAGSASTVSSSGTSTWSPTTAITDRAGNVLTTTSVNESGAADVEF